jgi:hypothetical protein
MRWKQAGVELQPFVKGGFYFHPSDEDLSQGAQGRKKPLG